MTTLAEIRFKQENTWNAILRHCKIGKVTRKYLPSHLRLDDIPMAPAWPNMSDRWKFLGDPRKGVSASSCSCLPGQACGNVACPYRLGVTY